MYMSNFKVESIINLIVYGVPALLILLGFSLYSSGYVVEFAVGSPEVKNVGITLMAIGIIAYFIEFAVKVYSYFS